MFLLMPTPTLKLERPPPPKLLLYPPPKPAPKPPLLKPPPLPPLWAERELELKAIIKMEITKKVK
jgi:hypothetical protein